MLIPRWVFYLVGLVYHALGVVVVYRLLGHATDPRVKAIPFWLTVCVMLLNELRNYGFFGMRGVLAGFVGVVVFLAASTF
jgi:hypothetical protein